MHLPVATGRRGFTLIEVLVVITIMGIAMLVMMPAIGRTVAQTRVERAASVMASDLKTAFAMAAQQRRPVRIVLDEGNRVFRIKSRTGDTTFLATWYNGSTDLVVRELTSAPDTLLIYPGGLAAGGLTVTLTTPGNAREIVANRSGQVRIRQP